MPAKVRRKYHLTVNDMVLLTRNDIQINYVQETLRYYFLKQGWYYLSSHFSRSIAINT